MDLKYTAAINALLIGATNPMVTTFLAILFLREKLTPIRGLGILLSFTGVFLIITNADWNVLRNLSYSIRTMGESMASLGIGFGYSLALNPLSPRSLDMESNLLELNISVRPGLHLSILFPSS